MIIFYIPFYLDSFWSEVSQCSLFTYSWLIFSIFIPDQFLTRIHIANFFISLILLSVSALEQSWSPLCASEGNLNVWKVAMHGSKSETSQHCAQPKFGVSQCRKPKPNWSWAWISCTVHPYISFHIHHFWGDTGCLQRLVFSATQ